MFNNKDGPIVDWVWRLEKRTWFAGWGPWEMTVSEVPDGWVFELDNGKRTFRHYNPPYLEDTRAMKAARRALAKLL